MYVWMDACMDGCMYVWMYGCMHVCMHVCMDACMDACMDVCMDVWLHAFMHACMYVCMYACMYVCLRCCIQLIALQACSLCTPVFQIVSETHSNITSNTDKIQGKHFYNHFPALSFTTSSPFPSSFPLFLHIPCLNFAFAYTLYLKEIGNMWGYPVL